MQAGYDATFVSLSALALLGFSLVLIAMPETRAVVTASYCRPGSGKRGS